MKTRVHAVSEHGTHERTQFAPILYLNPASDDNDDDKDGSGVLSTTTLKCS